MSLSSLGAVCYPAERAGGALLVLAHGAGAGQQHPFMVGAAKGLASRGIAVVTFDFPYMRKGRGGPDKPPVLEASFRAAIEEARLWNAAGRLFIGGKSMGGRMATHLGAQGVDGLAGIIALGYPLHPPGKPDQLRIAHLPSISAPLLIVQGERDAFGTPEELKPVLKKMTAPVTLHVVAGADHSLTVRSRKREEIFESTLDVVADWILRHS